MSTKANAGKRQKATGETSLINGCLALIVICLESPDHRPVGVVLPRSFDIQTSGWWTIVPHKEFKMVEEFPVPEGLDRNGVMEIRGATGTFEEFREGITSPEGQTIVWVGNKRLGVIQIQDNVWATNPNFTLDNYKEVLGGQEFEFKQPDGSVLK